MSFDKLFDNLQKEINDLAMKSYDDGKKDVIVAITETMRTFPKEQKWTSEEIIDLLTHPKTGGAL